MTKAKHCAECKFMPLVPDDASPPLICEKQHKPRFYQPIGNPMNPKNDWGWKRRCDDFELADHVIVLERPNY